MQSANATKTTKLQRSVAIYVRVSSDEQLEGYGEEMQFDKASNLIKLKCSNVEEWIVKDEHIYTDLPISGTTPIEERDGLSRLFLDLELADKLSLPMPFDYVVVYKIDRFARKLSILLDIVEMLKHYGVGFISTTEAIDTSTPFGNAMLSILGVFAELEREMILQRTSDGRAKKLDAGGGMSDKYGYIKDGEHGQYKVFEKEAKVVRKIFELFVYQGYTITQIRKYLMDELIPIPRISQAKKKNKTVKKGVKGEYNRQDAKIRDILHDHSYIGIYYYNKTKTSKQGKKRIETERPMSEWYRSPVEHEKIISPELFDKADILYRKNKGVFVEGKETLLLTKMLKCDCCKEFRRGELSQWTGTTQGGRKYYFCGGKSSGKNPNEELRCDVKPLPRDELDDYVLTNLKMFLKDPNTLMEYFKFDPRAQKTKESLNYNIERYKKIIDGKRQGLINLKDMHIEGEYTKQEYHIKSIELKKGLEDFEKKLMEVEKQYNKNVDIKRYADAFAIAYENYKENIDTMLKDKERCRRLIEIFIKEIIIYGRPKKDDEVIAGRRKQGQLIPYRIEMHFKLPQESIKFLWDCVHPQNSISNYHEQNLNSDGKYMFLDQKEDSLSLIEKAKEIAQLNDRKDFIDGIEDIPDEDLKELKENNKEYDEWILDPKQSINFNK